jgi:hypothetical protein
MNKEKQPKENNLSERVRKWYESYDNPPPWSSVAGFVVRELARKWGKIDAEEILQMYNETAGQIRQEMAEQIEKEIVGRLPAFPEGQPKGVEEIPKMKLFSAQDILEIINKLK